jgi:phage host-nuclease inhibitor protein Gam
MAQKTKQSKKLKSPATPVRVPQSKEEVSSSIASIGAAARKLARIEADMNEALSTTREHYEKLAAPYKKAIADHRQGVQIWCEANRDVLTDGGKTKTGAFTTGEVKWRLNPKSVSIKTAKAVLAALVEAGLERFVRTKQEIDKEAILADPDAVAAIKGITIEQDEEFVIEPFETKLQEVA